MPSAGLLGEVRLPLGATLDHGLLLFGKEVKAPPPLFKGVEDLGLPRALDGRGDVESLKCRGAGLPYEIGPVLELPCCWSGGLRGKRLVVGWLHQGLNIFAYKHLCNYGIVMLDQQRVSWLNRCALMVCPSQRRIPCKQGLQSSQAPCLLDIHGNRCNLQILSMKRR